MRKFIFLTFIFLPVFCLSTTSLFDLVEQFAGVRDFLVEFELKAEVKQQDAKRTLQSSGLLVIRNLEDFYFLVKEPAFISNLSFTYISRIKRLIFNTGSGFDFESLEIPISSIVQSIQTAMRILQTPLVSVENEGDSVVLSFSRFITQRVQEPIKVRFEVKDKQLKSIEIISPSGEEKIAIKINKLILNAKVDEYFQPPR
ncbi:hypothetical protein [Pseudothermotoga sp.]|uniref:hypothetical protein n=1 Tax=Pseudothermotoga sp. TaxID=2033661 RepID=UPI0031F6061C